MIQFKYLLFVFTVLKNEWFVYSTKSWSEQQKLAASDGMVGDWYGSSVALDGDTLVVGSYKDDDKGSNSGSVHVYVRSGTTWSVQQKLVADDGAEFDGFGRAVALSGETLVVGAYGDEDKGSVYVFVRSDTSWSKQQKITASDGAIGAYFGYSVALAVDTLVVGAEGDFVKGSFSGSVYVYVRSSSSWSLQQKITADDGLEDDYFGSSVAISGETLVVGAYGDDHGDNNMCSRCGSAYVYVRSSTSWSEQQKLVADDGFLPNTLTPKPGKIGEEFGISVAISGETLVVGAHGNTYLNDFYNGDASGSVYVYVRSGTSWFEQQEISSSASYEYFGISVALSSDNMVVGVEKGWVYEDYDLLDYDCDEVKKKTYPPCYKWDPEWHLLRGVYVYVRSGTSWSVQQEIVPSDGAAFEYFGSSVALSGKTFVVGAYGDDDFRGSAYIFAATVSSSPTPSSYENPSLSNSSTSNRSPLSSGTPSSSALHHIGLSVLISVTVIALYFPFLS